MFRLSAASAALLALTLPLHAQDQVWIQMAAERQEDTAAARAAALSEALPGVEAQDLAGRWFGVVLGPLERSEAETQLEALKAAGTIPADSFISDGGNLRGRVWPAEDTSADTPDDAPADPQADAQLAQTAESPETDTPAIETPTADEPSAQADPAPVSQSPAAQTAAPRLNAPEAVVVTPLEESTPATTSPETTEAQPAESASSDVAPTATDTDPAEQSPAAATPEAPTAAQSPEDTQAAPETPAPEAEAASPAETAPPQQTLAEARAAQRALTYDARAEVQQALAWSGHYSGTIDADFGPGTARAMAAYQVATGAEETGVLTTAQRDALLVDYRAFLASPGFAQLTLPEAGLSADIPLALVQPGATEPPFVTFDPANDSGVTLRLISRTGGTPTLGALYGILQSLPEVPEDGPRDLSDTRFTLLGEDDTRITEARAVISDGAVKGWMLVWPKGTNAPDPRLRDIVAERIHAGLRFPDATTLPAQSDDTPVPDLTEGLDDMPTPAVGISGLWLDGGHVLTHGAALAGCDDIRIDGQTGAQVAGRDAASGLVLITTDQTGPEEAAEFAPLPAEGAQIAVSGYTLGGALGVPTLGWGVVDGQVALPDQPALLRLGVTVRPGDMGGPVMGPSGGVAALTVPGPLQDRQMPRGTALALPMSAAAEFLSAQGLSPAPSAPSGADALRLERRAREVTALVECWR